MSFLLRDIDPKLWKAFKAKAEQDGRTMRWILLDLIRRYVAEGSPPTLGSVNKGQR